MDIMTVVLPPLFCFFISCFGDNVMGVGISEVEATGGYLTPLYLES